MLCLNFIGVYTMVVNFLIIDIFINFKMKIELYPKFFF